MSRLVSSLPVQSPERPKRACKTPVKTPMVEKVAQAKPVTKHVTPRRPKVVTPPVPVEEKIVPKEKKISKEKKEVPAKDVKPVSQQQQPSQSEQAVKNKKPKTTEELELEKIQAERAATHAMILRNRARLSRVCGIDGDGYDDGDDDDDRYCIIHLLML